MLQSIDTLTNLCNGIPELSIAEPLPGFPVIEIKTKAASARVALHGAQVLSWAPKDAEPVLYSSPRAIMEPGKAYRGGIPICWPWFGEHTDDPTKPVHGFARTRFWELTFAKSGASNARLEFRLPIDDETKALFPHQYELTAIIAIGDKLSVTLKTKNTGEELFRIGGALHTYLSVGDINRIQIEGLTECHYLDKIGTPTDRFQEVPLKIEEETDRIYRSVASVLMRDLNQHRAIFVDKAGSRSTVVWNPWVAGSKKIKDLPDRGYQEFVCLETANANKDLPTVRPGKTHTLETVLGIRPLT